MNTTMKLRGQKPGPVVAVLERLMDLTALSLDGVSRSDHTIDDLVYFAADGEVDTEETRHLTRHLEEDHAAHHEHHSISSWTTAIFERQVIPLVDELRSRRGRAAG